MKQSRETQVVAVVPVVDPDARTVAVCQALAARFPTVVVDDGSRRGADVFARLPAEVTVLRHASNRGKGAAIKTAVAWLAANRPDVGGVVFVDGDGQHAPEDVERVADRMAETDQVVFGVRTWADAPVPFRSRVGNVLTSGVVRILFGVRLGDTQTGLRAVPRRLFDELLHVPGERYEYETEMLGRLLESRERILTVPIRTVYVENNRLSHFRPVRDSLRIYAGLARRGVIRFVRFVGSSVFGFVVDNMVFTSVLFGLRRFGFLRCQDILIALVAARVVSASANYLTNRFLVFRARGPMRVSCVRYGLLALFVAALSYAGTSLLAHAADAQGVVITGIKIAVETVLFVVSYNVQGRWVFGV